MGSSRFCSSTVCFSSGDSIEGPGSMPQLSDGTALAKLSSNMESLLSPNFQNVFSDAVIHVQGQEVLVHRCILAARCPFFQSLFLEDDLQLRSLAPEGADEFSSKVKIDLRRLVNRRIQSGNIGYDSFMVVLNFLYTGRLNIPVVACADDDCIHETCRPVIDFAVEMLSISYVFGIQELVTIWQHYLVSIVEKAAVDDVLPILVAAQILETMPLKMLCLETVAMSNLGIVDLEKRLPLQVVEEIFSFRDKMGFLQPETLNPVHEKQCQRIQKALDSDDVELVQLLLEEGQISLDEAYALHYAAAYCDPHTLQEILELGYGDPNLTNRHGHTVLHVAARRREPTILVALLIKGANPLDVTPDGWTALKLSRRLTSSTCYNCNILAGEELQRDKICIEILEQAGKKNPFADAPLLSAVGGKEQFMRLLYLENRVALARLLFPMEVKVVMGISHLDTTSEFTGTRHTQRVVKKRKEAGVDLNQTPTSQYADDSFIPTSYTDATPYMDETFLQRLQALEKTAELGRRFFPRCTAILNTFMDDDLSGLTCLEKGSPDEQKFKRQRYVELKSILEEAFRKDVAAMDMRKTDKWEMQISSSVSSSSSRERTR